MLGHSTQSENANHYQPCGDVNAITGRVSMEFDRRWSTLNQVGSPSNHGSMNLNISTDATVASKGFDRVLKQYGHIGAYPPSDNDWSIGQQGTLTYSLFEGFTELPTIS